MARPTTIQVKGARVHNLKDLDVDIPLGELVAIAGVSGSGKSSLALGVVYAEGSRRYLEALSTYTRRRLTQASRAAVTSVEHVPAALALRQRPPVPGVRSTFGTSTELLNSLRLIYSRLGRHRCPNGHLLEPSMDVALDVPLVCPTCGASFRGPGAESFAFNSAGGCPRCSGTGVVRDIDDEALIPDDSLSIEQGAVESWKIMGSTPNPRVVAELGVRTDIPFRDLTEHERGIVLAGEKVKRQIMVPSKNGRVFNLNWTYRNARVAVQEALASTKSEKGLQRINRFLSVQACPDCGGSRFSERARSTLVDGIDLAAATSKSLDELIEWLPALPATVPETMRPMARAIIDQMAETATRLRDLGLGYLRLDRAAATLSTGERSRVQLTRAVRNRTTGVLYVLDEPSIGLHPANVDGLLAVIGDLLADGNSVLLVDHDVQLLRRADHLIEIGPGSGAAGGRLVAQGTVEEVAACPDSSIGGFLDGRRRVRVPAPPEAPEADGHPGIRLRTAPLHTVAALDITIPRGRLTAVTGVSGSGKTTLVLECLVPALTAAAKGERRPHSVRGLDPAGITRVNLIDATPIGVNVRSTVATYSGVLDHLRRAWADTPAAREHGWSAGDFSYNTGSLRCPTCGGTGQISLDVQFLPDVDIVCPHCGGTRYGAEAGRVRRGEGDDGLTLPELLALTVDQALERTGEIGAVRSRLRTLSDLGLGYLTLGESTPALSGGEAQRLKLATELARDQHDSLFVFDEPTVGLHPLDVEVLLGVLRRLQANGATVVVIEHDLDVIANADRVIDMGPGGGESGGRVVAEGTPQQVAADLASITGRYLREHESWRG